MRIRPARRPAQHSSAHSLTHTPVATPPAPPAIGSSPSSATSVAPATETPQQNKIPAEPVSSVRSSAISYAHSNRTSSLLILQQLQRRRRHRIHPNQPQPSLRSREPSMILPAARMPQNLVMHPIRSRPRRIRRPIQPPPASPAPPPGTAVPYLPPPAPPAAPAQSTPPPNKPPPKQTPHSPPPLPAQSDHSRQPNSPASETRCPSSAANAPNRFAGHCFAPTQP